MMMIPMQQHAQSALFNANRCMIELDSLGHGAHMRCVIDLVLRAAGALWQLLSRATDVLGWASWPSTVVRALLY